MRISRKAEYALRALLLLGRDNPDKVHQIQEVSEAGRIPVKFLEQILMQLKAAGYLESRRGKHGGYLLARPPENISMGQVVRLIDGPLAPIACVSQTAYERCTCPDEEHCGLRALMLDVRNAISNILDRYTLADVVEITMRKLRRDKVLHPFFVETGLKPPLSQTKARKTPKKLDGRTAA